VRTEAKRRKVVHERVPAAVIIPAPLAYTLKLLQLKSSQLDLGSRLAVRLAATTARPDLLPVFSLVLFTECFGWPERLL